MSTPYRSAKERAHYESIAKDVMISELREQVARLTAPVTRAEADQAWRAWGFAEREEEGVLAALTAFLERRMKGC